MNKRNMRVFIAAELPEHIIGRLEEIQERMKRVLEGVRWVKPASIHLTLKFLGDTAPETVEKLSAAVRECTGDRRTMSLSLAAPGVFPAMARPRVIWVGLDGDTEPLAALQQDIESELDLLGFPREGRPFRPHLTLGRVTSPRGVVSGLKTILGQRETGNACSFTLEGLTLFKSELRPQGALYTPLERYPFGS